MSRPKKYPEELVQRGFHLPGKIEIRFRDHRAANWRTIGGQRVRTELV